MQNFLKNRFVQNQSLLKITWCNEPIKLYVWHKMSLLLILFSDKWHKTVFSNGDVTPILNSLMYDHIIHKCVICIWMKLPDGGNLLNADWIPWHKREILWIVGSWERREKLSDAIIHTSQDDVILYCYTSRVYSIWDCATLAPHCILQIPNETVTIEQAQIVKSSGDTTHHHGTWLTLVLVIAFCLIAQRHYLHRATVIPIGLRGIHLRVISQKLLECDMINNKTSLKISHSKLQQHLPEFNELSKTILRSSARTNIEFAKVYQNLIHHAAMSYIMVELSTE